MVRAVPASEVAGAPVRAAPADDEPMSLEEACAGPLRGLVRPATLRAAIGRGELAFERLGRRYVVTPAMIRGGRKPPRDQRKAPASTSTPSEPPTSSATDHASSALAALMETVKAPKEPSPGILPRNTSRPSADIVPLSSRSPTSSSPTSGSTRP